MKPKLNVPDRLPKLVPHQVKANNYLALLAFKYGRKFNIPILPTANPKEGR